METLGKVAREVMDDTYVNNSGNIILMMYYTERGRERGVIYRRRESSESMEEEYYIYSRDSLSLELPSSITVRDIFFLSIEWLW